MLTKKLTDGFNENGSPRIEWSFDNSDGMEGVLLTGPAKGIVTLTDGTRYDVTPEIIEHGPGHAGPLVHHLEKRAEAEGGPPHTCTEACGPESEG